MLKGLVLLSSLMTCSAAEIENSQAAQPASFTYLFQPPNHLELLKIIKNRTISGDFHRSSKFNKFELIQLKNSGFELCVFWKKAMEIKSQEDENLETYAKELFDIEKGIKTTWPSLSEADESEDNSDLILPFIHYHLKSTNPSVISIWTTPSIARICKDIGTPYKVEENEEIKAITRFYKDPKDLTISIGSFPTLKELCLESVKKANIKLDPNEVPEELIEEN